jgi:hypothetical protein
VARHLLEAGFLLVLVTTVVALIGALFVENLRLKKGEALTEEERAREATAAGATATAPREPRPRRKGDGRVTEGDF